MCKDTKIYHEIRYHSGLYFSLLAQIKTVCHDLIVYNDKLHKFKTAYILNFKLAQNLYHTKKVDIPADAADITAHSPPCRQGAL